ncbi:ABC transporter substrate-binding protein [Microbacterium sp. A94]|uniref:ABC transporter substrate-binding protein n=1 Tax=Microbacterium sp. A94 TaxID=3450717 RepID=UPI003F438027
MFQGRRISTALAAASLSVLLLAGCAGPAEPQPDGSGEGAARADRLTLVSSYQILSLDIAAGVTPTTKHLFEPTFDTLIKIGASGDYEPMLATAWELNDDRTEVTLSLRDDVSFTDGEKFDATALVESLERYRDGTSLTAAAVSEQEYAVLDEYTVTITVPAPDPNVLQSLTNAYIASPESFDDPDVGTNPIGTGPYILDDSSVVGTTYNYTANPDYWNPDAIYYDNLTIKVIPDRVAALNAMTAGEANVGRLDDAEMRIGAEAAGWTVETLDMRWQGLSMVAAVDGPASPLSDVRVRRAINMAFDREALAAATNPGVNEPISQLFVPSSVGYLEDLEDAYPYDPDAAKALLADAGYADGFSLDLPNAPIFKAPLELVRQQLADIGITVNIVDPGPGGFVAALTTGQFPTFLAPVGEATSWEALLSNVSPEAPLNSTSTQDDKVDALMEIVRVGSEEEAKAAFEELNTYLVEQAWFAPLYTTPGVLGLDPQTEITHWVFTGATYPSILAIKPKN